jgi:histidinol-phosphate aminotransferase
MYCAARREIPSLPDVYHGGRLRESDPDLIDFSVSLNCYPMLQEVRTAVQQCDLNVYPDTQASRLRRTIAADAHIDQQQILITNGASQGIFLISLCYLERGDRVIIQGPTYGEYEHDAALFGAEIHRIDASAGNDFAVDTGRLIEAIDRLHPKLVWICNPNNPTGALVPAEQLTQIARCCERCGALLVVDEAYIHFIDTPGRYAFSHRSAIIIRSMTKDYGLAGLRIAYLVADRKITALLRKIQPQWSMNAAALAAAEAALAQQAAYERQWKAIRHDTKDLERRLNETGWSCVPSHANFILTKCGTGPDGRPLKQSYLRERLLEHHIAVRDCTSFGLSDHVRIGARTPAEHDTLIEVLQREDLWQ